MSANMNPTPNPNIASLTWKIDNFTTLIKDPLKSPSFSPPTNENVSFHLSLYHKAKFNYTADRCSEIMAVFLKRDMQTSAVLPMEYRVSLVNANGEKCHTIVKQIIFGDPSRIFTHNRGCNFLRNDLIGQENGFLTQNGTLTIYCEVEIIQDKKSHSIECCDSLAQDYGSLLESSKFSDVILVVGGHELKVHANILSARSKVFAAMFEHDCDEKRTNRVEITDVEKEVFDELLRFIYTGKVESLDQNASDLLIAADKYQLDQLKSICSQHLVSRLTPESVAPTLVLADMHQVTELKDKCIEYITKQDDIKLADWKEICESNLELAHLLFKRALQK